jgi:8-oxo-dGTP pyrophosphatase MutT (NUDIX family)
LSVSAIVPVPSATLTLVRETDGGLEVLMLQRNFQSGFVPGMYVFPGGALDAEDHEPALQTRCARLTDADASARLGVERGGLAYAIAAIRESFEEAGLLLAYDESGALVRLDSPPAIDRFRAHRHELNQGRRTMAGVLEAERLSLAVDRLVYFARWITPEGAPRRYDARFFAAIAPPAQTPLHDDRETISHVWVRPSHALDEHRSGRFKLMLPTSRTLEEFASYNSAGALMTAMRARRDIPAILPRIKPGVGPVLPGHPAFDESTDE